MRNFEKLCLVVFIDAIVTAALARAGISYSRLSPEVWYCVALAAGLFFVVTPQRKGDK